MATERFRKVQDLFEHASELPRVEWPAYLEEACGGDSSLRDEVESLLLSLENAGDFLQEPIDVVEALALRRDPKPKDQAPKGHDPRPQLRLEEIEEIQELADEDCQCPIWSAAEFPSVCMALLGVLFHYH